MSTRAKRFLDEALTLIGEQEDPLKNLGTEDEPTVTDNTGDLGGLDTGGDDLDLGAELGEPPVEDEFGLGASSTPSVRIEKDGPITVNKGDVALTIGDDGNIDITLDGGLGAEPAPEVGDMTDVPPEVPEESPEEDDYKIDWDKEKEKEGEEEETPAPKESKASVVIGMNKTTVITECQDKQYECMSCECYDECKDKYKKEVPEEESDFLTQGYK